MQKLDVVFIAKLNCLMTKLLSTILDHVRMEERMKATDYFAVHFATQQKAVFQ